MSLNKEEKLKILEQLKHATNFNLHVGSLLDRYTCKHISPLRDITSAETFEELKVDINIFWEYLKSKGYVYISGHHAGESFKPNIKKIEELCGTLKELGDIIEIDLDSVVFHKQLREEIRTSFENGDYVTCLSEATKLLERNIRTKAEAPSTERGISLASFAFNAKNGKLTIPYCQDNKHQEGIHLLYRGAFGYIRNLAIHHSDVLNDQHDNLQMIIFIDFLLRLLDQSQPRPFINTQDT